MAKADKLPITRQSSLLFGWKELAAKEDEQRRVEDDENHKP